MGSESCRGSDRDQVRADLFIEDRNVTKRVSDGNVLPQKMNQKRIRKLENQFYNSLLFSEAIAMNGPFQG